VSYFLYPFLHRLGQLIKRGILKQGGNLHHGWSASIFHVIVTASLFFLCRTDQPTVYAVSSCLEVGSDWDSSRRKILICTAFGLLVLTLRDEVKNIMQRPFKDSN
jgi:hypothetical protein